MGYYASVFYAYFTATGLDVISDDTTSHGREDLAFQLEDTINIIEFKFVENDAKKRGLFPIYSMFISIYLSFKEIVCVLCIAIAILILLALRGGTCLFHIW